LYRYCLERFNLDAVLIGHHRGDVTENVLVNIIKGKYNVEDIGMMK
jgi:tRNA(Ile)-lysidine synthase TilS/MesJ